MPPVSSTSQRAGLSPNPGGITVRSTVQIRLTSTVSDVSDMLLSQMALDMKTQTFVGHSTSSLLLL